MKYHPILCSEAQKEMLTSFATPLRFQRLKGIMAALRTWFSVWVFRCGKANLFEYRLTDDVLESSGKKTQSAHYGFREIAKEELPPCAALAELTLDEVKRRYDFGDRCFGLFSDGRLAHVTWLHFGSCYIRGLSLLLQLDDRDGYLYGAFTGPAHRGRGLFHRALAEIASQSRSQGMNRLLGVVEEGNEASLHVFRKLGYELVGTIDYFALLHFQKISMFAAEGHRILSSFHCRKPPEVFWI
jgi:GNAT superfamily N-acetyltransferase